MDNLKDEVRKSHLPKVGDIRFIERFVEIDANTGRMVKILQQFSLDSNSGEFGEYKWIDVPLIKQ